MQKITVLGATGSIGVSALSVVSQHPDRFKIFALSCNVRVAELAIQCKQFKPSFAVVSDTLMAIGLRELIKASSPETVVLEGVDGLIKIASDQSVDTVIAAIVGSAGLLPTLEAAKSGKKILLANKEALVMAGSLLMNAVNSSNGVLLPIDSEHNAIFQCLPHDYASSKESGINKILLTASGGPFRTRDLNNMSTITTDEACSHPNWKMGKKISVDSATMMNKGLELLEACWLFSLTPDQIEVVVHPQSIVHSMVEYLDGSILAQLGNPDMRTPIAHALAWPQRISSGVDSLDIFSAMRLDFEPPNLKKFPCLTLAIKAAKAGGSAPITLNASNEIAVEAFLLGKINFIQIPELIEETLHRAEAIDINSVKHVLEIDNLARIETRRILNII